MKRIKYNDGKAVVLNAKQKPITIRLKHNEALVQRAGTYIKLSATSPHKLKIAVKNVLIGLGVRFDREQRLR